VIPELKSLTELSELRYTLLVMVFANNAELSQLSAPLASVIKHFAHDPLEWRWVHREYQSEFYTFFLNKTLEASKAFTRTLGPLIIVANAKRGKFVFYDKDHINDRSLENWINSILNGEVRFVEISRDEWPEMKPVR